MANLGDIVDIYSGVGFPKKYQGRTSGDIPVVKVSDISNALLFAKGQLSTAAHYISKRDVDELNGKIFPAGSILFAKIGEAVRLNRRALTLTPCIADNNVMALVPKKDLVLADYVYFFMQTVDLYALTQATTIPSIRKTDVAVIQVPFVPIEAQKKIVTLLQSALPATRSARERIGNANKRLRMFRESIIEWSCSGRLIHPDIEDDDLPSGWSWITLEDLLPKGGIFDGPFGSNLKTADYTKSGVRVIRLENISRLDFIASKETYVSQAKYETLKRHTVQQGDILFSSFIDEKVRVCVLPELQTKAIAKADCFCIRPDFSRCDVDFIAMQLGSQATSDALIGSVHGATRPRVNTKQLRKVAIRIGPLNEQKEIVGRAKSLFAAARKVEQAILKTERGCDRTVSAVLASAFMGGL